MASRQEGSTSLTVHPGALLASLIGPTLGRLCVSGLGCGELYTGAKRLGPWVSDVYFGTFLGVWTAGGLRAWILASAANFFPSLHLWLGLVNLEGLWQW